MALDIQVNYLREAVPLSTQNAVCFGAGDMFRDADGDLYMRCGLGAVRFDEEELVPFSEAELQCFEAYPFLANCTPAEGDVDISINIKEAP